MTLDDDLRGRQWKAHMATAGVRQNQMAKDIGMEHTKLNKILNNWRTPTPAEIKAINTYLDNEIRKWIGITPSKSA